MGLRRSLAPAAWMPPVQAQATAPAEAATVCFRNDLRCESVMAGLRWLSYDQRQMSLTLFCPRHRTRRLIISPSRHSRLPASDALLAAILRWAGRFSPSPGVIAPGFSWPRQANPPPPSLPNQSVCLFL